MTKEKRQVVTEPNRRVFKRTAEQQRQMDELRRSNAAAPHVPKSRKGTRTAKNKRAIDNQL